MARQFSSNGRFNRGGNRRGNDNNDNAKYDMSGILWGNGFREENKHPVLQGYATVNGEKFRVAAWLNPGPDFRDDDEAQEYAAGLADELNNILLEAQEKCGIAFNLTFRVPEDNQQGGGGGNRFSRGGGGASRRSSAPERSVPFNRNDDREPAVEEEPDPQPRARKPVARKPAKKAAPKKRTARK